MSDTKELLELAHGSAASCGGYWGGDEMIEITEQDGELLIDGKPVDFQTPWKVEAAIRQLRADIAERDARLERAEAELVRIAQLPTVTYLYKFPYLGGFVWRNSAKEFNGASAVDSMELIQRPEQVPAKVAG